MNLDVIGGASKASASSIRVSRRPFFLALAGLFLFAAALRLYEQFFGWSAGLDSFAPEYQLYWGALLQAATGLAIVGAGLTVYWLWRTRDRDLAALAPAAELRRLQILLQLLTIHAIALAIGFSFFTEQTAVWNMTVVRDSDFTPSNIVTFHIAYPLFAIIGFGAFTYARTRLPSFAKGHSLAFGILVVGTFMAIPTVGFSQWGHTFWSMEETFASPVHWGFVFFGWMALAAFGVVLQVLARLRELIGQEGVSLLIGR